MYKQKPLESTRTLVIVVVVPIKFLVWSDRINMRDVLLTYELNAKAICFK